MDRACAFVDASYLLQEGAWTAIGTKRRAEIACDYPGLTQSLFSVVAEHSRLPVLRIYWYDAARGGAPARDHLAIAQLPNVKLRLGRLVERHNRLEQKGVDSLIVRDLMTLARERAIATAYLIAGDDDIREGVAAAQDMGVRVVLVGVPGDEANQAVTLVHEADELVMLDRELISACMKRAEAETVIAASDVELASQVGRAFARTCIENITREQLGALLTDYPRIPAELDAQLLKEAGRALGDLRDRFNLKVELRAAFWGGISEATAGLNDDEGSVGGGDTEPT